MKMMTILEGQVSEEMWNILRIEYLRVIAEKAGIMPIDSFLVQRKDNPGIWRLISIWESAEELEKMRKSGETPAGVLVFRAAGSEPTLSIFEVKSELLK